MNKIIQRLLIFFIGIPLLLFVIFFFPHYNHLVLNLLVVLFSVFGAMELRNIMAKKNLMLSAPEAIILGAVCPLAFTTVVSFSVSYYIIPAVVMAGAVWILVSQIFAYSEKNDSYIGRIAAGLFVMAYPGLFLSWMIMLASFREAGMIIIVYLFIVLLNDSLAWVSGNLFGKNNRGFVAASPGKSIAGFIGGQTFSVLTGIAAAVLFPDIFRVKIFTSVPSGAILGFGAGLAAILGDLGESVIKRSAGVKDSGSLILGRGGALDSIDSLALAAPVYYLLYRILFMV